MTDAELTLLSLLAEQPRFGYEIQQLVDERGLREWLTIGFSSIYYLLNKLERQSMIVGHLYPDGRGPSRKKYELTDAGRGILQTAIAELLRQPRAPGSGFELGLANLHVLKPVQVYRVLLSHRDDLRTQYEYMSLAWSRQQVNGMRMDVNIQALYTHNLRVMEAEIAWMDEFLAKWQIRYPFVMEEVLPRRKHTAPLPKMAEEPSAATVVHVEEPSNRLKMIQRLRRITPPSKPGE